jgi:mRNA interferase RelE/StbE
MNYSVEVTRRFEKEFKKLDSYTKRMIKAWIDRNLSNCMDPRRYRIGVYRLICAIEDDCLVILALSIGHRSEVYND